MLSLDSSLLIVSDLDGSLLDHHDYNWNAARQWLARLKQFRIPVIICSSKTAAEIVPLQEQLGIAGSPFIAEKRCPYRDDGGGDRSRYPRRGVPCAMPESGSAQAPVLFYRFS